MKRNPFLPAVIALLLGAPAAADESSHHAADSATTAVAHGSSPGRNAWNMGVEPKDWWAEVKNSHGHVGPWNVLGYRMGKAAMRELGAGWGDHTLNLTAHIPMHTPYSCILDGLAAGTGNSPGRLDLGAAEVASVEFLHVSARPANGKGGLVMKPRGAYLKKIGGGAVADLERLSLECRDLPESELFEIEPLRP
jgi:formylmethanofuran dehydrogenase subunit E